MVRVRKIEQTLSLVDSHHVRPTTFLLQAFDNRGRKRWVECHAAFLMFVPSDRAENLFRANGEQYFAPGSR